MTPIVLVDDDRAFVRSLAISLSAKGFSREVAADGLAAITIVTRVDPALVTVDVGLARLSGVDVVTAIRAWSDVPLIVVSDRSEESGSGYRFAS